MNSKESEISKIPYEVVTDKSHLTLDETFKLILIGDAGMLNLNSYCVAVGKSCLMSRVIDNQFHEEHKVTVGVEFGTFVIKTYSKTVKV